MDHKWIALAIDFEGYFSKKELDAESFSRTQIDQYAAKILRDLPADSFKNKNISPYYPRIYLDISESALYPIYSNPNIISIYLSRKRSE